MPVRFKTNNQTESWISNVPDWENNPEGGVYVSDVEARRAEHQYERRTGNTVNPDAHLIDLRKQDPEGWDAAFTWEPRLWDAQMYDDQTYWDQREQDYQRNVLKWPEDVISGEWFRNTWLKKVAERENLERKRVTFSPEMKDQIWLKTNGHCAYCGIPLLPFTNFTIDHVQPFSDGGSDAFTNLVPCCKTCNSRKHTMAVEAFRQRCGGGLFWIEQNGGSLS